MGLYSHVALCILHLAGVRCVDFRTLYDQPFRSQRCAHFYFKIRFSFHVHRITFGLSPLLISSETLPIEPSLFLDWSFNTAMSPVPEVSVTRVWMYVCLSHVLYTVSFGYNNIRYNDISLITMLLSCPKLFPVHIEYNMYTLGIVTPRL